jgi:hypothetical protein
MNHSNLPTIGEKVTMYSKPHTETGPKIQGLIVGHAVVHEIKSSYGNSTRYLAVVRVPGKDKLELWHPSLFDLITA